MMERGGRRRRAKGSRKKIFAYLLTAAIFMFLMIGMVFINQKALPVTLLPGLPRTSLVQCTITSENNSADTAGVITITVRHDLSPIASAIFIDLVQNQYFDGNYIFRVLKGFIAQWGIRHEGILSGNNVAANKDKDEIHDKMLSNVRGTLSFAGGNPVTQQVFVNLGDNRRLDKENSRPFAEIETGMDVMDNLYADYMDGQGQVKAMLKGLDAMREQFPKWSKIDNCRVIRALEK